MSTTIARLIVYGGRDLDQNKVYDWLDQNLMLNLIEAFHTRVVIGLLAEGGATGADRGAYLWAHNNLPAANLLHEPALWAIYHDNAGPIRNRLMFRKAQPNIVVEFPGNTGTADMRSVIDEHNKFVSTRINDQPITPIDINPDLIKIISPKGDFK